MRSNAERGSRTDSSSVHGTCRANPENRAEATREGLMSRRQRLGLPSRQEIIFAQEQLRREIPFGRQGADHRQRQRAAATEHLRGAGL